MTDKQRELADDLLRFQEAAKKAVQLRRDVFAAEEDHTQKYQQWQDVKVASDKAYKNLEDMRLRSSNAKSKAEATLRILINTMAEDTDNNSEIELDINRFSNLELDTGDENEV